ncbi:MAG: PIN domain-containing protein, partial [Acidimicrobiales bacterium]
LGALRPDRRCMAAPCPHRASPPQRALRRQDPRQEPIAVVPHEGICPGGRPQGRSLPGLLDAGALVAVERSDRRVIRLLELAGEIHVPAGALAQAWRNPARQVRLVRAVSVEDVVLHSLDAPSVRAVGQLCAATSTTDVVDASVVQVARQVDAVTLTSDAEDLRRLDPGIELVSC